jgi:hypothetical protein
LLVGIHLKKDNAKWALRREKGMSILVGIFMDYYASHRYFVVSKSCNLAAKDERWQVLP